MPRYRLIYRLTGERAPRALDVTAPTPGAAASLMTLYGVDWSAVSRLLIPRHPEAPSHD